MKRVLGTLLISAVAISGCGSDGGDGEATTATVLVTDAWARATVAAQTSGAVYFTIESDVDDTLVSVAVPDDVAAAAEIHESVPDEMSHEMSGETSDAGSMDEMGAMTMREVTGGVALAAAQPVTFEPGGYHVMLLDLADPLEVGEQFDMTLRLAHADPMVVQVVVAEVAP
jgi:periplasmic copper chaperone A